MKPVYLSPKISAFDNVLTDEDVKYLWTNHNDMQYYWVSNIKYQEDYAHWTKVLTGPRASKDEGDDIAPLLAEADPTIHDMWERWKIVGGDRKLVRIYVNGYTYGTEGYVHKDNPRDPPEGWQWETILVYCNPRWNMQWAGETIFFGKNYKDILYSSAPVPKRITIFNGSLLHVGRSSSRACPVMRKTLACKTLKKVIDEQKITNSCHAMLYFRPHDGKANVARATKVYNILKELGMPSDIRTAGLLVLPHKMGLINEEDMADMIGPYGAGVVAKFVSARNAEYDFVTSTHLLALEYALVKEEHLRTGCFDKQVNELYAKLKTAMRIPDED
jgi:SM-20-related protein